KAALELGVEVDVEPDASLRVDPARYVRANEPIEHRHADAHAAHRPANVAIRRAVTDPADVAEYHRSKTACGPRELEPAEPVGISRSRRVRTLSANGLRAAEVPSPLCR